VLINDSNLIYHYSHVGFSDLPLLFGHDPSLSLSLSRYNRVSLLLLLLSPQSTWCPQARSRATDRNQERRRFDTKIIRPIVKYSSVLRLSRNFSLFVVTSHSISRSPLNVNRDKRFDRSRIIARRVSELCRRTLERTFRNSGTPNIRDI